MEASSSTSSSVSVYCRFRPPATAVFGGVGESDDDDDGRLNPRISSSGTTVVLPRSERAHRLLSPHDKTNDSSIPSHLAAFTFDHIFDGDATQADVYDLTARPLVAEIMKGFNCTVLAFGQTGSGKTHTMSGARPGPVDGASAGNFEHNAGIVPRIVNQLFDEMVGAPLSQEFTAKASHIEIYNEGINDLLNPSSSSSSSPERNPPRIREHPSRGVFLEGATELYCGSADELLQICEHGERNRSVAVTRMNCDSSRSHGIVVLTVAQHDRRTGVARSSKMHLVDLAGSESVEKTKASGTTLSEAQNINKSLSALGTVIKTLTDHPQRTQQHHVPYRNSKLTRLLQESLGGNAKTSLILTCSGETANLGETLSTLRFGARAKHMQNHAVVNMERSSEEFEALLKVANDQIGILRRQVHELQGAEQRQQEDRATVGHLAPRVSALEAALSESEDGRLADSARLNSAEAALLESEQHFETVTAKLNAATARLSLAEFEKVRLTARIHEREAALEVARSDTEQAQKSLESLSAFAERRKELLASREQRHRRARAQQDRRRTPTTADDPSTPDEKRREFLEEARRMSLLQEFSDDESEEGERVQAELQDEIDAATLQVANRDEQIAILKAQARTEAATAAARIRELEQSLESFASFRSFCGPMFAPPGDAEVGGTRKRRATTLGLAGALRALGRRRSLERPSSSSKRGGGDAPPSSSDQKGEPKEGRGGARRRRSSASRLVPVITGSSPGLSPSAEVSAGADDAAVLRRLSATWQNFLPDIGGEEFC